MLRIKAWKSLITDMVFSVEICITINMPSLFYMLLTNLNITFINGNMYARLVNMYM